MAKHYENQVNLYVADVVDGGKTFKKARLPFQLTEHSYTILDTSEGSVFPYVNHGDYHTGYATSTSPTPRSCASPSRLAQQARRAGA